jgi:hypothetical protein
MTAYLIAMDVHQHLLCFTLKVVHELEVDQDSAELAWWGEKHVPLGFGSVLMVLVILVSSVVGLRYLASAVGIESALSGFTIGCLRHCLFLFLMAVY